MNKSDEYRVLMILRLSYAEPENGLKRVQSTRARTKLVRRGDAQIEGGATNRQPLGVRVVCERVSFVYIYAWYIFQVWFAQEKNMAVCRHLCTALCKIALCIALGPPTGCSLRSLQHYSIAAQRHGVTASTLS